MKKKNTTPKNTTPTPTPVIFKATPATNLKPRSTDDKKETLYRRKKDRAYIPTADLRAAVAKAAVAPIIAAEKAAVKAAAVAPVKAAAALAFDRAAKKDRLLDRAAKATRAAALRATLKKATPSKAAAAKAAFYLDPTKRAAAAKAAAALRAAKKAAATLDRRTYLISLTPAAVKATPATDISYNKTKNIMTPAALAAIDKKQTEKVKAAKAAAVVPANMPDPTIYQVAISAAVGRMKTQYQHTGRPGDLSRLRFARLISIKFYRAKAAGATDPTAYQIAAKAAGVGQEFITDPDDPEKYIQVIHKGDRVISDIDDCLQSALVAQIAAAPVGVADIEKAAANYPVAVAAIQTYLNKLREDRRAVVTEKDFNSLVGHHLYALKKAAAADRRFKGLLDLLPTVFYPGETKKSDLFFSDMDLKIIDLLGSQSDPGDGLKKRSSDREIAEILGVAKNSVTHHKRKIYKILTVMYYDRRPDGSPRYPEIDRLFSGLLG